MIEQLTLRAKVDRVGVDSIYVEYYPTNYGTENLVFHGQTLKISGSIKETVDAYEPVARKELLNVLNGMFAGQYQ